MSKLVTVDLKNNKGYSWYKYEENDTCVYIKGFLKIDNQYLLKSEFAKFIHSNAERGVELLNNAEGQFSFVILKNEYVFAAVDILRSFPLMYYQKNAGGGYIITDWVDEKIIKSHTLNKEVVTEFKYTLFVLENKTLLKNVYQIPSASYLLIDKNNLFLRKYWIFKYKKQRLDNLSEAVKRLSDGYDQLFSNVKTLLAERKILIPLSGGYDSRLVLGGLLKVGIEGKKIITFTYGDAEYIDSKISKKVAEKAGVRHYFISYDKEARNFYKNYIKTFFLYAGNTISTPCIQEWYALHKLKTMGVLDQDMVIISGYGGVLPGHYIKSSYFNPTFPLINEIKKEISDFVLLRHLGNDKKIREQVVNKIIASEYFVSNNEDSNKENIIEKYENWIFGEEQAKFIQNAVRNYEDVECEWITPFFFKQQFEIWGSISNSLRLDNFAFKKCMASYYDKKLHEIEFTGSKETTNKKQVSKIKKYVSILLNLVFNKKKIHYMFALIPMNVFIKNEIKKVTLSPNDIIIEEYLSWLKKCQGSK